MLITLLIFNIFQRFPNTVKWKDILLVNRMILKSSTKTHNIEDVCFFYNNFYSKITMKSKEINGVVYFTKCNILNSLSSIQVLFFCRQLTNLD